tara:strand:+ start:7061 stop:7699 length:639 start_codon:yes stop_codon:yes gene_type:complete
LIDVAIIDYNMGNLFSIKAAFQEVGLNAKITSSEKDILNSKIAILPGVGAFGEAISNIKKLNLDKSIKIYIDTGKPFVGICLGMQLLLEESDEFGIHKGLGVLKGVVKKFDFMYDSNGRYPIPQIGWNKVYKTQSSWNDTLLKNNNDGDFMYFVHSHYIILDDPDISIANTTYGSVNYCSALKYNNIYAVQFHPEKSSNNGLKIYKYMKEII